MILGKGSLEVEEARSVPEKNLFKGVNLDLELERKRTIYHTSGVGMLFVIFDEKIRKLVN